MEVPGGAARAAEEAAARDPGDLAQAMTGGGNTKQQTSSVDKAACTGSRCRLQLPLLQRRSRCPTSKIQRQADSCVRAVMGNVLSLKKRIPSIILLFIDNAPGHPRALMEMYMANVVSMPANTHPFCSPCIKE
ncbi:hypothetical protein QTO34_001639 [Cnephaeus nilssonii]|uniref:DDE-1 domain-containing protein n=1 Tax=Cnephaeus nilssonii TaxID=3371016 RepID=A0AA40LNQ5_CNENI|nr:hypothetical protein QTO34_001639 [Eptesicus nilssonii]